MSNRTRLSRNNCKTMNDDRIEKIMSDYKKDLESGLQELSRKGLFVIVVRYLFNPYLQYKERLLKDLKKIDDYCIEGITKNDEIVKITCIDNLKNRRQRTYKCYFNDELIITTNKQSDIVDKLRRKLEKDKDINKKNIYS